MASTPATTMNKGKTIENWKTVADSQLKTVLRVVQKLPGFKSGEKVTRLEKEVKSWSASVQFVNRAEMSRLNFLYRKKRYPTDILSFSAPTPFRQRGILGELVICLPVLESQALELGHSSRDELNVLLIHGVLHLLGFDHEKGEKESVKMAKWEKKILSKVLKRRKTLLGLIDRVESGKKRE